MTSSYQLLAERIQGEVDELERVVQRAQTAWTKARQKPEEDMYLDAVALNLHGFYSGVERLFELIAQRVDHNLPTGQTWHRDLLQQMAQDIPQVRPAVIGQDEVVVLDEFRRFRHLVRNVIEVLDASEVLYHKLQFEVTLVSSPAEMIPA